VRNPVHAEHGDVNSCGDWLAVALKDAFRTEDGGFDLTAFKACLKDNGVTPAKCGHGPSRRDRSISDVRRFDAAAASVNGWFRCDQRQEDRGAWCEEASLDSGSVTPVFVRVYNIYKPVEYRFKSGEVNFVGIGPHDLIGKIRLPVTRLRIKFIVRIERLTSQNGALDLIAKAILYL
jgi:hypothetical protein